MDGGPTPAAARRPLRQRLPTTPQRRTARYIVNDFEPVFDAADFVRCGRDLFCIRRQCDQSLRYCLAASPSGQIIASTSWRVDVVGPCTLDSSFVPLAPARCW